MSSPQTSFYIIYIYVNVIIIFYYFILNVRAVITSRILSFLFHVNLHFVYLRSKLESTAITIARCD